MTISRANQWERNKGEADFRASEILRRDRAQLRADGSAGVHDKRNQNIDVYP